MPPVPPAQVNNGVWFSFEDAQQIDKDKQELEMVRAELDALKESNLALSKQNENLKQQLEIQKQLTDIAEKKAEASNLAFEQMKDIADRSLALAKETNKPKLNPWQIMGGIIVGIITGVLIAP